MEAIFAKQQAKKLNLFLNNFAIIKSICIFTATNKTTMKTTLFNIAHSIRSEFTTFGQALKYSWKIIKLRIAMLSGIVSFSYTKKDGSNRPANGTLNVDYERKSDRKPNYSIFTYFDTDADGWRSCGVMNVRF